MSETIKAIYKNGIIEPAEPLKIAEGTEVYVVVPKTTKSTAYRTVLEELRREGFLDFDSQTIAQPFSKRRRGHIRGKPVSETIIEDRGPR
jgi:predicted DNA-binding antitoxin AbrB/MazE fold protein